MIPYTTILREAGIGYNPSFLALSEEAKLKVTDDALSKMMKFITDKYNSLDFSEIEKSAGDISRFKYTQMITENCDTLKNVYNSSTDPSAAKYIEVVDSIKHVIDHLKDRRAIYSQLYKSGNGMVQLLYTSLVAACLYATGALVSCTIRFVTTEKDTDCEVLYEEIPGSIKHVHIKNVVAAAKDIPTINRMLDQFVAEQRKPIKESVEALVAITAITAGMIILIPRIILLIREIIYSIYYSRVKTSEMLNLQIELIRTNIEGLESRHGNRKVIARQKKIVQKLENIKNRIAIKMDTAEAAKAVQVRKEDAELQVSASSTAEVGPIPPTPSGLMI